MIPLLPPGEQIHNLNIAMRYCGSKTWSICGLAARLGKAKNEPDADKAKEILYGKGYHFSHQKVLTPAKTHKYVRNAFAASTLQRDCDTELNRRYHLTVVDPRTLGIDFRMIPGRLEANNRRIFDPHSAVKVMIFTTPDEVLFSFGAVGSLRPEFSDNQLWQRVTLEARTWTVTIIGNLVGRIPPFYDQGEKLFFAVKDHPLFQGKRVTLIGHSMGGSLACYIGLRNQIQVQAFNSLALGAGLQQVIGDDTLKQAEDVIKHISIRGDAASDFPGIVFIDRVLSHIGLRTPGNFGRRVVAPSAYHPLDMAKTHDFFAESLQTHANSQHL